MPSDNNNQQTSSTSRLSPAHTALLQQLDVSFEQGLTSLEASARRQEHGANTVDPPIQCPAWICCLLPCIKNIPSQRAFLQMRPEDCEVKRGGRWMRYDASSLVVADIIRLEEGDVVPADCTVLLQESSEALLVDHSPVYGKDEKPASHCPELYWGGRVLVGSCVAVVTAVGNDTVVGRLIRSGRFPATSTSCGGGGSLQSGDAEDDGIALLPRDTSGKEDSVV